MTSRSASGEGESLKALMIHCSFGITTSRARIAAPPSQFTTMRIRSRTYAIGTTADDEIGFDMIHHLPYIENVQCPLAGAAIKKALSFGPLKIAAHINRLTV